MEMSYIDRREAHVTLRDDAKAAQSSNKITHSVPLDGPSELPDGFVGGSAAEPNYDLQGRFCITSCDACA